MTQPHAQSGGELSPLGPDATPSFDTPTVVLPDLSDTVTCQVCGTTFATRDTTGKCPVCDEQVAHFYQTEGNIPIISPVWKWLRQEGNWRLAAVIALIAYQIALFIALWIHLAQAQAF